jgi:formylglycine-generating enzyme required for sulfatase activity
MERLPPTEFEWEIASDQLQWGQLWEWTNSLLAYPGFNKSPGALGEYNGKFMINQMILREVQLLPRRTQPKNISKFLPPKSALAI